MKNFFLLMFATFCFCYAAEVSGAEAVLNGVKYEYSFEMGEAHVMGFGSGYENQSNIVIPDKAMNYPVTQINFGAFENASNLKKVDLSGASNLKVIGGKAFSQAPVEELILPTNHSSVTLSIQTNAFYLTKITKLDITCDVFLINAPFNQCSLKEVNFLSRCIINADAFFNCQDLKTLNFKAENIYLYHNALNAVAINSKFDINISVSLPDIDSEASQLCNPGNLGKVNVVCDLLDTYKANTKWMSVSANPVGMLDAFASLEEALPDVKVNNGSLKVLKAPSSCEQNTYTLFAVANEGFEFKQWADGLTDNPRNVEPVCAVCSYDADMLTPSFEAKANGIEEILSENGVPGKARKFMHNGQLVIVMPDGRAINALGQEIK